MKQNNARSQSSLIYSTEQGRMCPACNQPVAGCVCRQSKLPPTTDGIVRIQRETKGRKGKGVTVITGVPLGLDDLAKFAKQLKMKCGSGGTVKDNTIEIQGDHCDLVMEEIKKQGWVAKRSGG